jgi:hypothetical protein
MLKVGAVLRIHPMVVEVFSGRPDAGRVLSVQWFTVVEGGMGNIKLINTRKGEDMGVMELRKWLRERMIVSMRKVTSIVEIVGDRPQLQDGDSQQF